MPTDYGSLEAFEARLRDRIATHAADASGDSRTLPERGQINLVAEQLAKEMPRNVLKDNNGAIFVIDVDFVLSK